MKEDLACPDDGQTICACAGCHESAGPGRVYCEFCEDHHFHTHDPVCGRPMLRNGDTEISVPTNGRTSPTRPRFRVYDTFRLVKRIPSDSTVPVGTPGVVLLVFDDAYEVEFPDGLGASIGAMITYTLTLDYLE